MQTNDLKYTIFNTQWGFFGLLAIKNTLYRTSLPTSTYKTAKTNLLVGIPHAAEDSNLLLTLQEKIISYFDGQTVDFTPASNDFTVCWDNTTPFTRDILTACMKIHHGQTTTYSQLAAAANHPKAARAVGSALSKNPIPLIIPCHRVIQKSGQPGGFTAPGGPKTKQKLLKLEQIAGTFL